MRKDLLIFARKIETGKSGKQLKRKEMTVGIARLIRLGRGVLGRDREKVEEVWENKGSGIDRTYKRW